MGSVPYEAAREALYKNAFIRVAGEPWPTALLDREGTVGRAQLRPVVADGQLLFGKSELDQLSKAMWRQCEELSDLDADVLDALSALWLTQASSPTSDAMADVEELLDMRGLAKKRNGDGREGGYRLKQRETVLNALWHIQNLWLNVACVDPETGHVQTGGKGLTIQSRAFVITDRMGQVRFDGSVEVRKFVFRPGKVFAYFLFGPGRQTALLAAKALQYDPYHEQWEKRLARFISWQWRVRPSDDGLGIYNVRALLDAVGEEFTLRYPSRTRNRLEKALETLQEDGVVAVWQYVDWDENTASRYRWSKQWLQASIGITPPDFIVEWQSTGAAPPMIDLAEVVDETARPQAATFTELRHVRKGRGLTQAALAEHLGISQGYLSRIEQGKVEMSALGDDLLERIELWMRQP